MHFEAKAYIVGGHVRDRLMGFTPKDRDWVVVGSTPEEMIARGFNQVGADFPVFLHPESREEYALARTECKSGNGYQGFTCAYDKNFSLKEDLRRRDLTINAIAEACDGTLVDPYNGKADIQNRILRHVSEAFADDPVRVLRVARFAARFANLGFTVAPETHDLMKAIVESGELQHLTTERIWLEILKAFETTQPSVFLGTLRTSGALEHVLPEVDDLYGVPQPPEHHPEIDSGIHTEMVIDQARHLTSDTEVLFAALTHDLGKVLTLKEMWPSHHGHEKAGVPLVDRLSTRLKVPSEHRRLALLVCEHHLRAHLSEEMRPAKLYALFEALDAFRRPETLQKFLLACEADKRGRLGFEDRVYTQRNYILRAFEVANAVKARQFVEKGYEGPKIMEMMRTERISRIRGLSQNRGN